MNKLTLYYDCILFHFQWIDLPWAGSTMIHQQRASPPPSQMVSKHLNVVLLQEESRNYKCSEISKVFLIKHHSTKCNDYLALYF